MNDRVLFEWCSGALRVILVGGRVDLPLKSASREGLAAASVFLPASALGKALCLLRGFACFLLVSVCVEG